MTKIIKTVNDLIKELYKFPGNYQIQVNIPSIRPGDEGPVEIQEVALWTNDNIVIIEPK